jgi:hypothetical protein
MIRPQFVQLEGVLEGATDELERTEDDEDEARALLDIVMDAEIDELGVKIKANVDELDAVGVVIDADAEELNELGALIDAADEELEELLIAHVPELRQQLFVFAMSSICVSLISSRYNVFE